MSDKQTVILVPVKPRTTDLSIKNDRVIFVPLATKDSFGVVKVGDGLLIDDGLLSFDYTDFEQAYLDKKLDKFQGIDNSGKILYVGSDGNISLRDSEYKGISIKEDDSLISSDTLSLNFKDSFDVTSSGTETSISLKDIYVKKFNYSEFKEIESLNADTWVLSDSGKHIFIGDIDFTGSSPRYNNTIQINRAGVAVRASNPSSSAFSMINCTSDRIALGNASDTGNFTAMYIRGDGAYIGADKILTEAYISEDNLIYLNQDKLDFNTDKLIEDLNNYDSYTLANNNISLQHTGSDSGNGSTQFLLRRNDSELYLVSSEDSSGSKLGMYFNGFDVGVEYMNGNVNLLTDTVYWNGQPLALDGINNVDTDMIVDGAITTSKISDGAVTDSKIDSVSGTKVSGVVRTTQQTITNAEKQQAQKNITHTAWQDHAASGVQVGWYQVANLKTQGNYDIKIKQAYNYNFPEAVHLSISVNNRLFTGQPFASITQLSGVKPAAFALSKIRVRGGTDEGTTFLDVYNPDRLWNTTWVDITSDTQDVEVETNHPFEFIGTEDNPSGYKVTSLDLITGFNTSYLRANTATISGTVTDLNTISQPVNSVVTYSFVSGCANAPIPDSGMVTQMQATTAYCTQLVIMNDEKASTWRRSYRDGTWTDWEKLTKLKSRTFTSAEDFYNFMQENIDSVLEVVITTSANITGVRTQLNITSSASSFTNSSNGISLQAGFEYRFNQFYKDDIGVKLKGTNIYYSKGENNIDFIVDSSGAIRIDTNSASLTDTKYTVTQILTQGQRYNTLTFKVYYFD